MSRCSWDAEMDAALQADAEKLLAMSADPGPELEDFAFGDDGEAELCELIFDNVEASVDHVGGKPIAVLSDVKAAADAIIAAGYRKRGEP